ncbi:hypothetical protein EC968_000373 [Mortierella alpina]|nr:hypothetical protein EC968_000373 [Mortierella alpina]
MSSYDELNLDLKCLVFTGSDGTNAYGLVKARDVYFRDVIVLVQAIIPADDPQLLKWDFVTAAWSFQESHDLQGDTASCVINKAGELTAVGSWSGIERHDTRTRHGLVYNPFNPLPLVGGLSTSNALWTAVDMPTDTDDKYVSEWAQLMIDIGSDHYSEREIVLTNSQIVFRYSKATTNNRELINMGAWTLPRALTDASTAQLQYSDNSLYVFITYGANDTLLMRIPFNPNSSIPYQLLPELPSGTSSIDIVSTANKCDWSRGYSTAVSDNRFYILCQKIEIEVPLRSLFVYDNTENPKLGAAIPVTGIDPSCTIKMFQPLRNKTFAMLACEKFNVYPEHVLLTLSGSNVGNTIRLATNSIRVAHDTLFNNIIPGQGNIRDDSTDGIPPEEGKVGLACGLTALAAMVLFAVRYKLRKRTTSIHRAFANYVGRPAGVLEASLTIHSGKCPIVVYDVVTGTL